MKGYSFRSLTDLVLKIFKTKVNAGTGLSGGGSLEADRTLTVKYGTAAGTAAQGNDSRLSNSREWIAETISQAEAEYGAATYRRAFTAQRVRQAIVAWWNGVTGVFGRDLVTSTSNTAARSKLGLGTAATRDVGISDGGVIVHGASSLITIPPNTDLDTYVFSRIASPVNYTADTTLINAPIPNRWWCIRKTGHQGWVYFEELGGGGRKFKRFVGENGTLSGSWIETINTNSILPTTGQSTEYPMTQKAVTDQLATKAASSHTHPWGQVTGQPATATRWPTFAEVAGKPATYAPSSHTHPVSQVIGLGTAATRNVGTVAGNVMEVGAFGLGGMSPFINDTKGSSFSNNGRNEFFSVGDNTVGKPLGMAYGQGISISHSNTYTSELVIGYRNVDGIFWRGGYDSTDTWQEIYHSGNFNPNSKANTSTQVIAGTGLLGGGNLTSNRTLSIAASHTPIGVGQTWQDLKATRLRNVNYVNTTGRPIQISITVRATSAATPVNMKLYVAGVVVAEDGTGPGHFTEWVATNIIPAGAGYNLTLEGNVLINTWAELR